MPEQQNHPWLRGVMSLVHLHHHEPTTNEEECFETLCHDVHPSVVAAIRRTAGADPSNCSFVLEPTYSCISHRDGTTLRLLDVMHVVGFLERHAHIKLLHLDCGFDEKDGALDVMAEFLQRTKQIETLHIRGGGWDDHYQGGWDDHVHNNGCVMNRRRTDNGSLMRCLAQGLNGNTSIAKLRITQYDLSRAANWDALGQLLQSDSIKTSLRELELNLCKFDCHYLDFLKDGICEQSNSSGSLRVLRLNRCISFNRQWTKSSWMSSYAVTNDHFLDLREILGDPECRLQHLFLGRQVETLISVRWKGHIGSCLEAGNTCLRELTAPLSPLQHRRSESCADNNKKKNKEAAMIEQYLHRNRLMANVLSSLETQPQL